ncbi:hypothetical protein WG954_08765 [Lacibacter sp. H375]|uniref:TolB family protein n=1 Tax=Lacibacter sp. H375 TaxID=3133424 RepID=UPI0030BB4EC3
MKKILSALFLITCSCIAAQDNDCLNRQLAKAGKWTKLSETVKSNASDLAVQRRFYNAVHNPLQAAYQPKGLDAAYSGSFQPVMYSQPVAHYWYTLFAERYLCEGDALVLNKFDISSIFTTAFNYVSFLEIYDTTAADNSLGFRPLREGFPVEIRPGIWQFNDVKTSLGAGNEGLTKLWLITYDGQLPWSFVTRREFLLKRKRFVQKEMAAEAPRLKDQLAGWEQQKKYKEQEYKSDPARLATYISGTHNPAIERVQASYKKLIQGYENALARLDEQLSAPSDELNKWAIVIKSTKNNFDYDFTDKMEPFAELLTKPNPTYFKKWSSAAVPQMITVSIRYDPKNPVMVEFAKEMEKNVSLDYLKSFIGKTAPPSSTVSSSAQNQVGVTTNKVSTPASPNQTTSSSKTNKETTSKPLTPQGPLASNGMFLTGTLSAPAGVPVTLAYNNGNDLTITPPKGNGNLYTTSPIRFSKSLKEEEAYNVMLKKIASNMKGVVYYGKGKAPGDVNKIKVGVDFTYELLTRSSDDKMMSSFYESFAPAIGGFQGEEGRYVVFVSGTKDFAGSNGKFRQVFWRDRNTGVTKMISVSASGEQGNADCAEPSVSADGQIVVFESKATNLVSGDNNNVKDIFLWRKSTNSIELISKATNGAAADAESFDASISGNGNFVVFTSPATNLASVPKGRSLANIFLRDIQKGKTEMISVDPVAKTGGNGYKGSISFDGARISFCSPSGTLVTNDNNNLWDIFLWQRGQSGLKRISMTHDGKEKNGGTESASRQVASSISGNGRFVAFATTASNMVPNDNNKFQDVFVVDVETGKVNVASFTDDGQASNNDSPIEQGERVAISYDGTWVAFPTKATNLGAAASNIILHNTVSGKKTAVSNVTGSYVGRPSISYSGSYVIFGKSVNLDNRFSDSGIFAHFTGNGPCRDCKE